MSENPLCVQNLCSEKAHCPNDPALDLWIDRDLLLQGSCALYPERVLNQGAARAIWGCVALSCMSFPLRAETLEPSPLTVSFEGPEICGPPTRLEEETRALLGIVAETADVKVVAHAEQTEAGQYRVDLEFKGAVTGSRRLESKKCAEAVQAAAVILALAIQPDALSAGSATPPPTAPSEEPKDPAPLPNSEPERLPTRTRLLPFLGVQARVSGGVSPALSWGPLISVGIDYGRLRILAQGYSERSERKSLGEVGEVQFQGHGGGLDACGAFYRTTALTARGCAGLTLSRVLADPTGLENATQKSALLVVPEAGLGIGVRLHRRLDLSLCGDVLIPTTNPTFSVGVDGTSSTVHRVSLGGAGALGLTFNLDPRDPEP